MGSLLYLIEQGSREGVETVARPETCRAMINVMLGQEDHEKIAGGLPRGVAIANKTGEISGVRNDVAIVEPFGDTPYVLCVYSRDIDDYAAAIRRINQISNVVYAELGAM
jgi:beta-lactamase class A